MKNHLVSDFSTKNKKIPPLKNTLNRKYGSSKAVFWELQETKWRKSFCWKIEGKVFAGKRCRFQLMVVSLQDDVVSKELYIAVYYAARDVQRRVKSDADRAGRVSRFSLCSFSTSKFIILNFVWLIRIVRFLFLFHFLLIFRHPDGLERFK